MLASTVAMESFGAMIGMAIVIVLIGLIILGLGVLGYVFRALSLYTIAKRRGIINPWLAWIPIGEAWILGSISDQYQQQVKGRVRNRESVLLALNIAMLVMSLPIFVADGLPLAAIVSATGSVGMILAICLLLVYFALSIVTLVFTYIAMHDLYASCDPVNAVLFLVLGIFIDVIQPFFLFACRKKDLGMACLNQVDGDCVTETNLI